MGQGVVLDRRRDCVVVNREQETNLPGVYAAGDVTCGGMQVATAVGEGVMAALQSMKYLRSVSKE